MKITTLVVLLAMLVLIPIASAQDIVAERGETSVRIYPGEVIYGAPAGTVVIETQIDGERFVGSDVNIQSEDSVKYASGETNFFIFPDPKVQQLYEYKEDGSLEDTVFLKEAKDLSYHVELTAGSYLVELEDGSYKIANPAVNETTEGYIVMSKPFGTDANGQTITDITYTLDGDILNVNLPAYGDAGAEIVYPISIDPILDHRYDLKLLLHGNLEPTAFSTTDFRDSSRYFMRPINSGNVTVSTVQKKYGNASYLIGNGASLHIPNSSQFTFGTNNFSISGWMYYPTVISTTTGAIYSQNEDANNLNVLSFGGYTTMNFLCKRGGVNIDATTATIPAVTANTWHHFAFIQSGNSGQLYYDGAAVGSPSTRTGSLTALKANVTVFTPADSTGAYADELLITNGGFAPTIADLYSGGEYPLYLNASVGGANLGYGDDGYTLSLLHMDGANGGTTFVDQVANRTWTTGGSAKTNTTDYKFGSSGWFDYSGSSYLQGQDTTSSFDMGNGNFTIDGWIYPTTNSIQTYAGVFSTFVTGGAGGGGYLFGQEGSALVVYSNASGTPATKDLISSSGIVPINSWSHIALVRNGNDLKIYLNGNMVATRTVTSGYIYNAWGRKPLISGSFADVPGIWGFNGNIDELRITKGYARWTSNFTTPTTPYELITNVSSPVANPTGAGTVPATISFTDGVPSNAWTANTFNWSFGDGGYSSEENPSHTYTTAGIYPVSFTVSNNNMSTTTSTVVQIGAPFVDFSCSPLAGTAALQVTCTDLTTNTTPITSYTFDWGDGTSTTDTPNANNQWTHVYSTYGAFSPNLTEINSIGTGYMYKRDYIITSTNQNQQQTFYSPHEVTLKIEDRNGNVMIGVSVNATADESTLPGGIEGAAISLADIYGIKAEVARQMVSNATHMVGTTGSDGKLVFTMHGSLKYNCKVTDNNGQDYTTTFYPLDSYYNIRTTNTGVYTAPQDVNSTYSSIANSTLTFGEPNASYITLGLDYLDISGRTSAIQFYTRIESNGTYIDWTNVSVTGQEHILLNNTYRNKRAEQWKWGFFATRVV